MVEDDQSSPPPDDNTHLHHFPCSECPIGLRVPDRVEQPAIAEFPFTEVHLDRAGGGKRRRIRTGKMGRPIW